MQVRTGYDHEDAGDFLDKVDEVHQQVQDIISGKIDCVEADRQYQEKAKLDRVKAELKEREAHEAKMKGRPGKGYKKTGWFTFCNPCWTEFFVEGIDKCTHCGRDTVTYEVSDLELHDGPPEAR